ncbi:hypothetical protein CHCC14596_2719 [Bacillus licheniformis]|nr:hypothetical protein CHCC14596_2719 [Bacillus licheniformis]
MGESFSINLGLKYKRVVNIELNERMMSISNRYRNFMLQ